MAVGTLGFMLTTGPAVGQPSGSDTVTPQSTPDAAETAASDKPVNWFVRPTAAGTRRDTEPPSYVRPLSESGLAGTEDLDWLLFGLEHRTRFEMRDDNYRRGLADDERFLMRSRVYFGIREILDPFRFAIEFQDSRQFGTELPELTRDANEADFLQAYGELFFADALGKGQPIRFQAGRMAIDYIDRRLVSRNRFRNTTNAFDGFRLKVGEPSSPWEVAFFAVQPVQRQVLSADHPDEERWFYGLTGAWRKWSSVITLEPYWFILDEDRKSRTRADRELHTMGLHGYGPIGDTGFDYDFDVAFQFGENGQRDIRAFASYGEVGYTFDHPWKPRLAVSTAYASGDRTPGDSLDERFDSLFGSSKTMYSFMNLFPFRNLIQPALWLQFRPTSKTKVAAIYRANWLASDSDSFIRAGLRDPSGDSGDFVGQEIDLQIQHQFTDHVGMEAGYAHFFPGPFTSNVGGSFIDDADFFYLQMVFRF